MALGGISMGEMERISNGAEELTGHDLPALVPCIYSLDHLSMEADPPEPQELLADEMGLWWTWGSPWTSKTPQFLLY